MSSSFSIINLYCASNLSGRNLSSSSRKATYKPKGATKNGKKGELIVKNYLLSTLPQEAIVTLQHLSVNNITPGYDIEYTYRRKKYCIEVKSTSSKKFNSIIFTAHEYEIMEKQGDNYYLYLVASCNDPCPKIQIIQNPYKYFCDNSFEPEILSYQLFF